MLRGLRASQQCSAPRPHHRDECAGRPERPSPPGPGGRWDAGSFWSRAGRSRDESVAAMSSTRLQSRMEKWKTSGRFLCLVHIESPTSPQCTYVVAGSQDGEVPSSVAGHTVGLGLDGSETSNVLQWMPQVWGCQRAGDAGSRDLSDLILRSVSPPPWGFPKSSLHTGAGDAGGWEAAGLRTSRALQEQSKLHTNCVGNKRAILTRLGSPS